MTKLNFTIDSEIMKKFLSVSEKNEGIRLLNETFLNHENKKTITAVFSFITVLIFINTKLMLFPKEIS